MRATQVVCLNSLWNEPEGPSLTPPCSKVQVSRAVQHQQELTSCTLVQGLAKALWKRAGFPLCLCCGPDREFISHYWFGGRHGWREQDWSEISLGWVNSWGISSHQDGALGRGLQGWEMCFSVPLLCTVCEKLCLALGIGFFPPSISFQKHYLC